MFSLAALLARREMSALDQDNAAERRAFSPPSEPVDEPDSPPAIVDIVLDATVLSTNTGTVSEATEPRRPSGGSLMWECIQ